MAERGNIDVLSNEPKATVKGLTPFQVKACLALAASVLLVGIFHVVANWQLDASGMSLLGKRLPYWDFTNLWSGSVMALDGHADWLFDVDRYRAELNRMFSLSLPAHEWSYPPSIILIGAPLALLPIWLAHLVWSAGTLFAWHLALRPFRLPPLAHLFALLSPATMSNLIYGQNGALTAALLIGGLMLAPARPVLAGVLFGLLTIKPHLGILIPFCLIASWNVRAFMSAAVTGVLLATVTGLLFGFDVWTGFLTETSALMTSIMQAPYPQAYHTHAVTAFVAARSLGLGVGAAYAVQGFFALAAIGISIWLWRPSMRIDHRSRVALTGALTLIVLPYGYTYDTAPVFLAVVWFLLTMKKPNVVLFSLIWIYPLVFPLAHEIGMSAGFFGPAVLVFWLAATIWRDNRDDAAGGYRSAADPATLTAS